MKKNLLAAAIATAAILVAGSSLTERKINNNQSGDPNIEAFLRWAQTVESFEAQADNLAADGRKKTKTIFRFRNPRAWELLIYQANAERAHWLRIDDNLYVKDYSDGLWWKDSNDETVLTAQIDFRKLGQTIQQNPTTIKLQLIGEQQCGKEVCLTYKAITPDYQSVRETIDHELGINKETKALVWQKFKGDTGQAWVTYSNINQVKIELPTTVKKVMNAQKIFVLPGTLNDL